jgi:nucleotide-binding universal stress UspA family protein
MRGPIRNVAVARPPNVAGSAGEFLSRHGGQLDPEAMLIFRIAVGIAVDEGIGVYSSQLLHAMGSALTSFQPSSPEIRIEPLDRENSESYLKLAEGVGAMARQCSGYLFSAVPRLLRTKGPGYCVTPQDLLNAVLANAQGPEARALRQAQAQVKEPMLFDVFLCHNSQEKEAVRRLNKRLVKLGLRPWLDEEQLLPGRPWQDQLEKHIGEIRSAAVIVGSSGIGPWQNQEMRAFLSEFVQRNCPVIPVLLKTAPSVPDDLPIFLRSFTWVDFRRTRPAPLAHLYLRNGVST